MVHFAQELDQCHAYITALQSSCTQSSISAKENQKISDTYIKQRTPPHKIVKKDKYQLRVCRSNKNDEGKGFHIKRQSSPNGQL